ncbi:hypothetical protein BDW59DRAFT_4939 [Aspergillus cavernicola]|uniref:SGNH hydrolase-type esterase domain-containing protein n=1 Tax=Aspergillus cavernicola TaxID=176166 RepID=A0ABR4J5G3_9EURO
MKLASKFHIVCAFAVFSIILSALFLGSQHFYYRRVGSAHQPIVDFQPTASFDRRLVVFGDTWSDNNAKEIHGGSVWTDRLCSSFSCHHENLAQTAKSLRGAYIGSIVDNEELSDTFLNMYKSPLADLKSQVNQWLATETKAVLQLDDEVVHDRRNRTIVVVSFGVWDLWNAIGKDYEVATKSIDHSVEIMMEQLDLLSQNWGPDDLKIILTLAPDVTFLPGFRPLGDQHVSQYKEAVKLVERWNTKLRGAAEQWGKGTIYLFDTEAFLIDLIRDRQLYAAGVEEANGLGKNQDPGWENVEDACVESSQQWVVTSEGKRCEDPEKYLFWDDMHLGPSAHRLMGAEVFHGIDEMWLR